MSLVINNNTVANATARHLNDAYSALSSSTEKMSSGLRINSAADDAAGLAVRELMRSDISTSAAGCAKCKRRYLHDSDRRRRSECCG